MKLIAKTAAITAAAAMTATGLIGAISTSASAATTTKSVTYSCDLSVLGQGHQDVTAVYTVPAFPTTLPAGTAVPSMPIAAQVTLPASLSPIIIAGFNGDVSGTVTGNVGFGSQNIVGTLTIPTTHITDPSAAAVLQATGTLASFTPSTAGANAVSLPSAVTASLAGLTVPCAAVPGSDVSLGSVNVVKVTPTLKATAKKIKAGHVAKIKVVTTPAQTGKAIAKIGKKKVAKATLKNGKATLKVKGLKKTTKVKVFVGSLKAVVKVKVKK
jgi:hypothetical protein